MTRDQWVSSLEWAAIAGIIVLDIAFAAATGIAVENWQKKAAALAIIIAAWPAIALLTRLTGFAKGSAVLAEIPGKALAYILVASILEYFLATSGAPFHDGLLGSADRALGFDWPTVCVWIQAHPRLHDGLAFAYFSLAIESCAVLLLLCLFYPARARRFTTALIVSSLFTLPLLWVFPVGGPFVAFHDMNLPQGCFSDAYVGTQHYLKMRAHAFLAIDTETLSGIVTFPSYHATAAALLTYFMRRIPILFPAACLFNAAMIAATPVIGGHYLIDVIAGLVVAAATIYVIERVEAGRPAPRLALWRKRAEEGRA